MTKRHPVTIVVPVYADWASLKDCIQSLIEHVDTTVHRVMFVNDCGPDVDDIERRIKSAIKGHNNFLYFRNPKNLGFVGTCNRAVLELDTTDNDILLLNSDTIVTEGFVEEMSAVLYGSPQYATVSPRTNNATIATIPLWSIAKRGVGPKKSWVMYGKIRSLLPRVTVVPVGHGFCMLIRRTVIKRFGLFDTAFGRGYGEEVDFCMRVAKEGYQSVLANHAFVFHMEARSFSHKTKQELLEAHGKIIRERYPEFSQLVGEYVQRTTVFENAIQESVGIKTPQTTNVEQLIKRVPLAYGLARRIKRLVKA